MIDNKIELKKNNWNCVDDLNKLLPEVNVFPYKGSIDRYGFSHILSNICGFKKPKRAFAEWVHGWHWHDLPSPEILGVHLLSRSVPIIVANNKEFEALKSAGYKNIIIGGLPSAYIKKQHSSKNENALLAIPPHTGEDILFNNSQNEYLDYLESLKNDFNGIYVSIFYLDWEGPLHKAVQKRGLNVIQGARPDDANSLIRMRCLFDAFNYVTSNYMGSHFIYAQFANCKFSLSGPKHHDDEETWLGDGNIKQYSLNEVQKMVEVRSEKYLRSRFSKYFVNHPKNGICDIDLASSEIGLDVLLSKNEILEAIGWNLRGQLRGYFRGALNRGRTVIFKIR